MKRLTMLLLMGVLCGCEISLSRAPVGEAPLNIADETEAWEGFWVCRAPDDGKDSTGPVMVTVQDATNGVLKVEVLGPEDKDKDDPKKYTVYLKKGGDWTLASVELLDEKKTNEPPAYAWGRLKKSERMAYLWWARKKALDPLVKSGKIPAYEPDGKDEVLGAFNAAQVAEVTCETNGVLYMWGEPLLFMRAD